MIMLRSSAMTKKRVLSATEFKAKCSSLLDEIQEGGAQITVTRRGIPVAVMGPAPRDSWKSPANSWRGKLQITGDIVNCDFSGLWNVVTEK